MRISDWSSDVCSSDLARPVGAFRQRRAADPKGVERGGGALAPSGKHGKRGAWPHARRDCILGGWFRFGRRRCARRGGGGGDRRLFRGADRTSVGSGKSGSVRVSLGGRRSVKKKKNRED